MPTTHELRATPDNVHWGFFDAKLAPVLRVKSGDRIELDSISGGPNQVPTDRPLLPDYAAVHARHKPELGPHILTGPIHVEGAEPGDTIEVRILDVRLRQDWGYNIIRPLSGTLPEDFGSTFRLIHIPIARNEMVATMPWGAKVPLSPFFGVIGTAPPPAYGRVTSMIPREFGGNLDNKELLPGSRLFLPVFVPGALVSIGDGHAVQGDGEVCVTALETSMAGTFELVLRKDLRLKFPRAETPTHYITMGLDLDLDDAAKQACREMIALLGEVAGLAREDAYTLMSLACDVRVTQLVDGNKGIHAMIAKAVVHS